MPPTAPEVAAALDGEPISVPPGRVGCRLLAADRSGRYGATFTFCCTEAGSWSAEAALHWRSDGLDWWRGGDGWHDMSSGSSRGDDWDWDFLADPDRWEWGVLWTLVTTCRDGELDDGREVRIAAIPGFAAPVVATLRCECESGTHDVTIGPSLGAFVAIAVTTGSAMTLVARDSAGAVLQRKPFDLW